MKLHKAELYKKTDNSWLLTTLEHSQKNVLPNLPHFLPQTNCSNNNRKIVFMHLLQSVVGGSWTRSIVLSNSSEGDTIIDLKPDTGYEFYLEVV